MEETKYRSGSPENRWSDGGISRGDENSEKEGEKLSEKRQSDGRRSKGDKRGEEEGEKLSER